VNGQLGIGKYGMALVCCRFEIPCLHERQLKHTH
jgi:hypothetical protein